MITAQVALIAGHVQEFCAKRFAPHDGIAAIAGMSEILGAAHLGNVPRHEIGRAAIAVAGQHQSPAADCLACAVGAGDFDTADHAPRIRKERAHGRVDDRRRAGVGGGLPQTVDQFNA
jgi:hypothetical protein